MVELIEGENLVALGDLARDPSTGVTFHELAPLSIAPPRPPRFALGDFNAELIDHHFQRARILHEVGVFVAHNLSVSANYLLRQAGQFVYCPEANIHPAHLTDLVSQERFASVVAAPEMRVLPGVHASICGPGYYVFGHWLVDILPKLHLLAEYGQDISTLSLLVPNNLPRFATDLLRLIGIRDSQLVVYDVERQAIVAETLLIPTTHHNAVRFSALFPATCRWLAERIEATNGPTFSRAQSENIFLARRGNRPLVNRSEIEDLAAKRGFHVVQPERLPLLEQWKLISSARCLLGEYGSALHACMFSPAKTIVCALRADKLFSGFLQSGIGEALNQPTGYIFGNTVDEQRKSFSVRPELLETFLQMIDTPEPFA